MAMVFFFSVADKIGDFFQCSSIIKLFSEIIVKRACGVRVLLFLSCVDVICNTLSRAQCGDVIFSFFFFWSDRRLLADSGRKPVEKGKVALTLHRHLRRDVTLADDPPSTFGKCYTWHN